MLHHGKLGLVGGSSGLAIFCLLIDLRLKSKVYRAPSARSLLLFGWPKRSSQEKATPDAAVLGHPWPKTPRDTPAVRARDIHGHDPAGLSLVSRRRIWGPGWAHFLRAEATATAKAKSPAAAAAPISCCAARCFSPLPQAWGRGLGEGAGGQVGASARFLPTPNASRRSGRLVQFAALIAPYDHVLPLQQSMLAGYGTHNALVHRVSEWTPALSPRSMQAALSCTLVPGPAPVETGIDTEPAPGPGSSQV
ncbi:hypothetical protein DFR29_101313 [Tahibacter aquaticus]|uniref:Uncharacterized protein n=1 Tax=Tahibacter aquaticus TaxID=520092 RepID=A0A4R6Z9U4_9GAMM|nr:hypothetical protein DFR29_101313 [Tahibacter aquaticus]